MKRYDGRYFAKWYRDRRHAIGSAADLERQVSFAVAAAEQVIGRAVASVLDLGAGEGRWQPVLHRLRPRARYAGVDSSEWAVNRWGARRNLRLGTIGELDAVGVDGPYDLVVAADVLHYLPAAALRRGLAEIEARAGGVAYLPLFTSEDNIDGDREGFQRRNAAAYRRLFHAAGLTALGMHLWLPRSRREELSALEGAW
ncbi:MAG TPA: class I SAM-dependent methyltransferase [Gemmatimonadales bacterium]|nr:class I SAM-dependent methyltransferase [Gemmatimonadales bacterium]